MLTHTRSVKHRVFEVWRSPGRFTKNPDLIRLPSGRLMLVYCDNDAHWSLETQIITLLASDDDGQTWFKHREIDRADLRKGDERLVTPRLSQLNDGRLVILIDHDDFGHFHEDQPSGNWVYWSEDDGETWTTYRETGISGFEPDRMMDLPDGRLAVVSHVMRGDSQEFAVILSCSDDGGSTWYEQATIAHDGLHRFCEGALVVLNGGKELACIMRENHSAGIPCFAAFSRDHGVSWTTPQMMPFSLHRPYAKQLADGRVLVTGRQVSGGLGTYGWCGDFHKEAGSYAIGGPRRKYAAELSAEALTIINQPDHECRYTLLPPESSKSEVVFQAEVKIEADTDEAVAYMAVSRLRGIRGPIVLYIGRNWIALTTHTVDFRKPVDMSDYRKLTIHHRRGLLTVQVDGETIINSCVFWEADRLGNFHGGGDLAARTGFGQLGDTGKSCWRELSYKVTNPTLPQMNWRWRAADVLWPDAYQRERMIEIHANHPDQKPWPDHGYSSWLELPDGRIMFVDYTNQGDEPHKSHLVGVYLHAEDYA
ncbi:sialidase family protein [Paenibacillus thalictri]|uniref:exo-alpha-sialidase n=1 Tax=Paenibacillus thalictri TaxID=2527873 RepID=A0A4Q9DQU2_9BACL|nr:sialidase family protein [Paenibacillus thalictri]TBL78979.1 exo-alpha-sialidase [Paenibacillus thalictri]